MIGIYYKGVKACGVQNIYDIVMLQYGKKHYQKEIKAIEMIDMFPQTNHFNSFCDKTVKT